MNYELFEMANQEFKIETLSTKAWHYLRKITEKNSLERNKETKLLFETIAANKKNFERMAIDIADISQNINRRIERTKEKSSNDLLEVQKLIDAVLRKYEIEIIDPNGMPIDDDLANLLQVIENIPKRGVKVHQVGEVYDIIVKLNKKTVRSGKVIGWYPQNQE